MSGFAFEPLVAAVGPGTEMTVTNEDSAGHSFTAPRLGVDRTVSSDDEITFTVSETGTFDYVCTFHPPDMLGRIVMTEDTPTPTPADTTTTEDDGYY